MKIQSASIFLGYKTPQPPSGGWVKKKRVEIWWLSFPIAEGTYFLRNKQTKHFADIKGPTMAAGTTIHQWEFHGGNSQKWIFDYYGEGYYTLKSANSTNVAYYLGVKDDLDAEDTPIVLRTGTITDGMLWQISTTTSGAYRLTPKTGNWCLATSATSSTNGNILYQDWYAGQNQSYRDEWMLALSDAIKPLHVPSTTFTIQCLGDAANSEWFPLISASVDAWNNSSANTNISLSTASNVSTNYTIRLVNDLYFGGDGLTTALETNGFYITKAEIVINVATVSTCELRRKCVITHEIGHLLGLEDFSQTDDSIMSYNHDCLVFYTPQSFDVYNVKFIYNYY